MNFSKLSDDVLRSKIIRSRADINDMAYFLNTDTRRYFPELGDISRIELEIECVGLANECKRLKAVVKEKEKQIADQRRLEEEAELEASRKEKQEKTQQILDNSIVSPDLLTRLKFRFFNHAKYDDSDPEGLDPLSSGPFFEDKHLQFSHELSLSPFRLYSAEYSSPEMSSEEEYKQRNLNKLFGTMVEDEYKEFLFVCFRVVKYESTCKYYSLWISNHKMDLSSLFTSFEFHEFSPGDYEIFANLFKKTTDENVIDEFYAR
jgi:hypothetical protein